jgi:hypothetical protein
MNTEPMRSGELDMEKVKELKAQGWGFQGLTKEEYEGYTPYQRVLIASGNLKSLEEMDESFGVKTDIGETEEEQEEFYKGMREHQKKTSKAVQTMMRKSGGFDYE